MEKKRKKRQIETEINIETEQDIRKSGIASIADENEFFPNDNVRQWEIQTINGTDSDSDLSEEILDDNTGC